LHSMFTKPTPDVSRLSVFGACRKAQKRLCSLCDRVWNIIRKRLRNEMTNATTPILIQARFKPQLTTHHVLIYVAYTASKLLSAMLYESYHPQYNSMPYDNESNSVLSGLALKLSECHFYKLHAQAAEPSELWIKTLNTAGFKSMRERRFCMPTMQRRQRRGGGR